MPKTSKATASRVRVIEGVGEGRSEDLDGYTVSFSTYTSDHDAAEAFKGLPDDRCQARHWGYVLAGKVGFRYADREETFEAGDAYYAPPGHTPIVFSGAEVVEFSPADEAARTGEVVRRNLGDRVR
ncbi:MAG: cupin domain-containing protein [Gaiellaceae bacterium]